MWEGDQCSGTGICQTYTEGRGNSTLSLKIIVKIYISWRRCLIAPKHVDSRTDYLNNKNKSTQVHALGLV